MFARFLYSGLLGLAISVFVHAAMAEPPPALQKPVIATDGPTDAVAFTPDTVLMETEADSALSAKNRAQNEGALLAFRQIITALDPKNAPAILSKVSNEQIQAWVQGIEVLEERMSARQYRARLKYSFNQAALAQLLGASGDSTGTQSTSVLVLPILQVNNDVLLWESINNWRSLWNNVALEEGRGKIILPFGDTQDLISFPPAWTQNPLYGTARPAANRYGVNKIVVARASYRTDSDPMMMTVVLTKLETDTTASIINTYTAEKDETLDMLLLRAAKSSAKLLEEERLAQLAEIEASKHKQVMILARIVNSGELVELRKRLEQIPAVKSIEWRAVSAMQADMVVRTDDEAALAEGIKAQKLILDQTPGTYWTVSWH